MPNIERKFYWDSYLAIKHTNYCLAIFSQIGRYFKHFIANFYPTNKSSVEYFINSLFLNMYDYNHC